jgi:hypothetical protein
MEQAVKTALKRPGVKAAMTDHDGADAMVLVIAEDRSLNLFNFQDLTVVPGSYPLFIFSVLIRPTASKTLSNLSPSTGLVLSMRFFARLDMDCTATICR